MTLDQVRELAGQIAGKRLDRARAVIAAGGMVWSRGQDGRKVYVPQTGKPHGTAFYEVTAGGCTCIGHQQRGYCKHFDAVMLRIAERQQGQGTSVPTLPAEVVA